MASHIAPRLAAVMLVASSCSGVVLAAGATDEDNGLSANETATLWSHDTDSRSITNAEYEAAYGESRTAMEALANVTDITFSQPPATARTWSRFDHADFQPGNASTSIAPQGVERRGGRLIRDAHVSIFTLTPATVLHESPEKTTRYVSSNGTVRGIIDYRLALDALGNDSVVEHRISEIRLFGDETVLNRTNETHRPVLSYTLEGQPTELTLEADIVVRVDRPVRNATATPNATVDEEATSTGENTSIAGHHLTIAQTATSERAASTSTNPTREQDVTARTNVTETLLAETVTVSDTLPIEVYRLTPTLQTARYPTGERGVALSQSDPWHSYTLGEDGEHVRSVWRFYTASKTDWTQLTVRTATNTTTIESASIPVEVHAYPSALGPQVRPTTSALKLVRTWGPTIEPPQLESTVLVDVVNRSYEQTRGIETRQLSVADEVTVHGIINGVNTTLTVSETEQILRESELSLRVVGHSESGVTLVATLRDATTGDPIVLGTPNRTGSASTPTDAPPRQGTLTVDGHAVETNASGMVLVSVDRVGIYTAHYRPESWVHQDVAYTDARATARWHPLTHPLGWLRVAVDALVWLAQLLLALLAGRTLSRLFTGSRYT